MGGGWGLAPCLVPWRPLGNWFRVSLCASRSLCCQPKSLFRVETRAERERESSLSLGGLHHFRLFQLEKAWPSQGGEEPSPRPLRSLLSGAGPIIREAGFVRRRRNGTLWRRPRRRGGLGEVENHRGPLPRGTLFLSLRRKSSDSSPFYL